jgi:hypothetical protein
MTTTWKSKALAGVAVAAIWGCGAEPDPRPEFLSWQAIFATLTTQEGIALDEEAAWDLQRQALDRCWSREPLLMCVSPAPPWQLGFLHARAVPADIEAAWARGELISSNEAMNRLVEEFHVIEVRPSYGAGTYEIELAPTAMADGARYSSWGGRTLMRMDRLAERVNQEVDGLEVETMTPLTPGTLDELTWSQKSSAREIRWGWMETRQFELTVWDCRISDDSEADVSLEISGAAPSYAVTDACLERIEEGRYPL